MKQTLNIDSTSIKGNKIENLNLLIDNFSKDRIRVKFKAHQ